MTPPRHGTPIFSVDDDEAAHPRWRGRRLTAGSHVRPALNQAGWLDGVLRSLHPHRVAARGHVRRPERHRSGQWRGVTVRGVHQPGNTCKHTDCMNKSTQVSSPQIQRLDLNVFHIAPEKCKAACPAARQSFIVQCCSCGLKVPEPWKNRNLPAVVAMDMLSWGSSTTTTAQINVVCIYRRWKQGFFKNQTKKPLEFPIKKELKENPNLPVCPGDG